MSILAQSLRDWASEGGLVPYTTCGLFLWKSKLQNLSTVTCKIDLQTEYRFKSQLLGRLGHVDAAACILLVGRRLCSLENQRRWGFHHTKFLEFATNSILTWHKTRFSFLQVSLRRDLSSFTILRGFVRVSTMEFHFVGTPEQWCHHLEFHFVGTLRQGPVALTVQMLGQFWPT